MSTMGLEKWNYVVLEVKFIICKNNEEKVKVYYG